MILLRIHNKLEKIATQKGVLILFFLAHSVLLLMMQFTFPRMNAKLGTEAFDLKTLGYSEDEAIVMLQNLDPSTIDFYLFPQLFLLDVLYPILLALFLSTLIIRLSRLIKIDKNHSASNLFILPFIAMTADYLENIMISYMITHASNELTAVIKIANVLTLSKGICTTLSWLVILILFSVWLFHKFKKSKTTMRT